LSQNEIQTSWKACLRRTTLADNIEDSLLAIEALDNRLKRLKSYCEKEDLSSKLVADDHAISLFKMILSLSEQVDYCHAAKRDLQTLLRKTKRTGVPVQ
jgi:hypothetical protein